jgi:hypothetical protein
LRISEDILRAVHDEKYLTSANSFRFWALPKKTLWNFPFSLSSARSIHSLLEKINKNFFFKFLFNVLLPAEIWVKQSRIIKVPDKTN